jgi:hypothetical protein
MDGHHKPPLALLLLSPVRKQMMSRGARDTPDKTGLTGVAILSGRKRGK